MELRISKLPGPVVIFLFPWLAHAADPLSLRDAVAGALRQHPLTVAAAAREDAAGQRIQQAQAGLRPRATYQESATRSDNPVFVFSSLLSQRQFRESNFAIGPLNRPDGINNFQSLLTAEQTVYDGGQTASAIRGAQAGRQFAAEDTKRLNTQLMLGVSRAYLAALLASEKWKVATEALRSAAEDRKRAENIRAAGMSTDADVLSVRVHEAEMREREVSARTQAQVAEATLNQAMGLPLETKHTLTTPLSVAVSSAESGADTEKRALEARPELRQSLLAEQIATTQVSAARAAFRPQVTVRVAIEADRQRFVTRGGANYLVGAGLRWNLFNGYADRARAAEAKAGVTAARALRDAAASEIRLEVRKAQAELVSAAERIGIAEAAVAMAAESLRITRNRYEAGLATLTDLLRTGTAHQQALLQRLAAIHDQRLAAIQLEAAKGTLTGDSDVL